MIKEQLIEIGEMTSEEIRNLDQETLVHKMVQSIGHTDPELRDNLIYTTFFKLMTEQHLSDELMSELIITCMDDEHLFFRIGEENTDSVFTRSFSALVVALVLDTDVKGQFLSKDVAKQACDRAVDYLLKEKDVRGFDEEKGWAHAVAHGADLLATAVEHPVTNSETFYPKALDAVKHCVIRENGVYINEEDERLQVVIHFMLEKGINPSLLENWIDSIWNHLQNKAEEGWSLSYFHLRTNVTNFLKTLYFLPILKEKAPECREKIDNYITGDVVAMYRLG